MRHVKNWKAGSSELPHSPVGEWLDILREQDERIRAIPGACLSNQVGGLFCNDMRRAWTAQCKLSIDTWFKRTDSKGRPIVHFYSESKQRRSAYLQIHAGIFICRSRKVVLVRIPKVGIVKLRGWNHKITYALEEERGTEGRSSLNNEAVLKDRSSLNGGNVLKDKNSPNGRNSLNTRDSMNGMVTFFDHFRDSHTQIGCRIEKDRCGDYYMILSLKNIYRPFQVITDPAPHDIEIHVDGNGTMITSDGQRPVIPPGALQKQEHISHLRRQLGSRYGPANRQYRDDRRKAKKYNSSIRRRSERARRNRRSSTRQRITRRPVPESSTSTGPSSAGTS